MQIRLFDNFQAIPALAWNQLAGSQPFLQHAFLAGLESCGCATPAQGWAAQIITVWDGAGEGAVLQAAMPLYAKSHSMGEFVFDWAWADAYARHGLNYYPKLAAAVPFSPVQGQRLLATNETARIALLDAALAYAMDAGYSSLHVLFPLPEELPLLEAQGMLIRQGVQFHWQNAGYRDFNDFLAVLTSDKRKKIKQERRRVAEAGITFKRISGAELTPEHLAFAYACYANTYAVRGREAYLSPEFFAYLGQHMAEHVLLVLACRGDEPVAMALNLYNGDTLWGRYWGYVDTVPCLHFETCYYQTIEFCIARGIQFFEGGAQGEHKLARGFLPVTTYSAHWLAHPTFRDAVANFLQRERAGIEQYMDELNEHEPYRKS